MTTFHNSTPEGAALDLMNRIMNAEDKAAPGKQSREYILSTYAECLRVVNSGKTDDEKAARNAQTARAVGARSGSY